MSLTVIQPAAQPAAKDLTGKKYWQSLDQLADTAQFRQWVHKEFADNATELLDGNSRRTVLKLMAASFGLAGLTACSRPVEKILPNVKGIEDYVPGQSYFYSTAFNQSGQSMGLLVETHDGRPTKVEGNPDHPYSQGASSAFAQASILNLYDPDRSRMILKGGQNASWKDFESTVKDRFGKVGQGEGLRFLSETINSPSLIALKAAALQKYPQAKWIEWEPVSFDNAMEGSQLAFGQIVEAIPHFDKADIVVSLDGDFLGVDSYTARDEKEFAAARRLSEDKEEMNRLYAVESNYTLTGAMADHRLRMRASDIRQFAVDLAAQLGAAPGLNVIQPGNDKRGKILTALVKDLKSHSGKSLIVTGPRQPAAVHALVHAMNQTLGNAGTTVTYVKRPEAKFESTLGALRQLTTDLNGGHVNTLIILGGNPAYAAPADFGFANAIAKAGFSLHLGQDVNETASVSQWHFPEAHYLESWGDGRAADGTVSIQQPMIEPLYGGKSQSELLALLIDYKDKRGYDIVRNYWSGQLTGDKENGWKKALNDGILATAKYPDAKVTADTKAILTAAQADKAQSADFELVFFADAKNYDGRYANNGWLQELPEPMTKIVWGNAALISVKTARDLNVTNGDVVSIQRGGQTVEFPVYAQPGHADQSVTLPLGYGRTKVGRVGEGVGTNAYPLRTSDALWIAGGAKLSRTGKTAKIGQTQEYHVQSARPIVREASIEEYKKNPKFAEEMVEHPPLESLYPDRVYDKGYQWGMSIDLNSCTGCNACMIACQAENNIPIVGKEQVMRGREMHWIRMDRYFVSPEHPETTASSPSEIPGSSDYYIRDAKLGAFAEDPEAVFQPLPCMQCENAPCENVCPVAATVHSPEGLNDMAYNRCVGTRYCANNCPYKVRRFNFLNYHKEDTEVQEMVYNPDVSVRMRGVMEKCNYCVQRIQEAKIKAKVDGRRPIKDGEVVTACAQACASEAIVFGDINDPATRVSKLKKQERNYALLAELNVRPRTTYLAKVRNPNPEISGERKNG